MRPGIIYGRWVFCESLSALCIVYELFLMDGVGGKGRGMSYVAFDRVWIRGWSMPVVSMRRFLIGEAFGEHLKHYSVRVLSVSLAI